MFCRTVLGKLLHTVRQVLAEEELDENIGDISKKVCHNFPGKWALSVQSPQNLTKLLHLRPCDTTTQITKQDGIFVNSYLQGCMLDNSAPLWSYVGPVAQSV